MSVHDFNVSEVLAFMPYDETFLACSWDWLNDKEIKAMTMTPDITREIQREWFSQLNSRDYYVWGVACCGLPIGVVGLKHVDLAARQGEYFGYIGEKEYWGRGIGAKMIDFIRGQAKQRGLETLSLIVSHHNERAIRLYLRYGFSAVEQTDKFWTMRITI